MNFLRKLASGPTKPIEEREETVHLADRSFRLLFRHHPRARRIKLMVDVSLGLPVLTLPPGISEAEGLRFVEKNIGWLDRNLDGMPDRLSFAPDIVVPFKGVEHRIFHEPNRRGTVQAVNGVLSVTGGIEHLPRRLTDFIKKEARATIKPLAQERAKSVGRAPGRISLRDQRTRWGSCSAKGDLSFSWRLILAPPDILDYVVSHEVAHLVHMDHSAAFWRTVETMYPEYRAARDWLGTHGARLHRIG